MTVATLPGPVQLWLWNETADVLSQTLSSGPGSFAWPVATVMCAQHKAFTLPPLLVAGASTVCQAAYSQVRQALSNLGACRDIEQPDWYVLSAPAAQIDATTTADMVSFIGVLGEALSHAEPLPDGLLPSGWVAELRVVLDKLRHDTLADNAAQALASYHSAVSLLSANAGCFDPSASSAAITSIGGLTTELNAAVAYLEQLKTSGDATVASELSQLAANSRARLALSYPSLTWAEREWLAFWFGGVAWRCRGDG